MELIATLGSSASSTPRPGMKELLGRPQHVYVRQGRGYRNDRNEAEANQVITVCAKAPRPLAPRTLHKTLPHIPRQRLKLLLMELLKLRLLVAKGGTYTRIYTTPERAAELDGEEE